ncbi:MAG: hypothetical protein ACTH8T_16155 [Brevibacterium aurantiacum]|uniref:hypothetical protein n=1 Tax=Brevibacterium aurantiacum TaxID=273384 RepID=UPI0003F90539
MRQILPRNSASGHTGATQDKAAEKERQDIEKGREIRQNADPDDTAKDATTPGPAREH